MIGNHDATPVGVAVAATHALERKPVRLQRPDKTTSRQSARGESYIDDDGRLRQFYAALVNRNHLAGFEKVLNIKVDGLADIRECLLITVTPGMAALERWAGCVPRFAAILEFIGFDHHF